MLWAVLVTILQGLAWKYMKDSDKTLKSYWLWKSCLLVRGFCGSGYAASPRGGRDNSAPICNYLWEEENLIAFGSWPRQDKTHCRSSKCSKHCKAEPWAVISSIPLGERHEWPGQNASLRSGAQSWRCRWSLDVQSSTSWAWRHKWEGCGGPAGDKLPVVLNGPPQLPHVWHNP